MRHVIPRAGAAQPRSAACRYRRLTSRRSPKSPPRASASGSGRFPGQFSSEEPVARFDVLTKVGLRHPRVDAAPLPSRAGGCCGWVPPAPAGSAHRHHSGAGEGGASVPSRRCDGAGPEPSRECARRSQAGREASDVERRHRAGRRYEARRGHSGEDRSGSPVAATATSEPPLHRRHAFRPEGIRSPGGNAENEEVLHARSFAQAQRIEIEGDRLILALRRRIARSSSSSTRAVHGWVRSSRLADARITVRRRRRRGDVRQGPSRRAWSWLRHSCRSDQQSRRSSRRAHGRFRRSAMLDVFERT